MPRKTDGIEFELHSSPQKDKNGKPLLYVKLASKKKLTFAQLESYSISHKQRASWRPASPNSLTAQPSGSMKATVWRRPSVRLRRN